METRTVRIALVLGAVFGLAACESPTAPAPARLTAPVAPTPTVTALTISGSPAISAPGGTTQLTATATYPDESRRDVTTQAWWSSSNTDVVSVISPGLIRGERYGEGGVRATYGSASATAEVRVGPDGAFLVTVAVSDHGFATEGARVQVTSAAGMFSATTDLWGVVFLPAVGDAMLQVEKAGFRTIRQSVIVNSNQVFDFVLQASDGASPTIAR